MELKCEKIKKVWDYALGDFSKMVSARPAAEGEWIDIERGTDILPYYRPDVGIVKGRGGEKRARIVVHEAGRWLEDKDGDVQK